MSLVARFLVVGGLGTGVNLGAFLLLTWLGVNRYVASPIAIELSILHNYVLHDRWTFRDRRTGVGHGIRGARFHVVSVVSLLVSYLSFVALNQFLPQWPPVVHQLLAIPPATAVNFLANSLWTFRDRSPSPPAGSSRPRADSPSATGEAEG